MSSIRICCICALEGANFKVCSSNHWVHTTCINAELRGKEESHLWSCIRRRFCHVCFQRYFFPLQLIDPEILTTLSEKTLQMLQQEEKAINIIKSDRICFICNEDHAEIVWCSSGHRVHEVCMEKRLQREVDCLPHIYGGLRGIQCSKCECDPFLTATVGILNSSIINRTPIRIALRNHLINCLKIQDDEVLEEFDICDEMQKFNISKTDKINTYLDTIICIKSGRSSELLHNAILGMHPKGNQIKLPTGDRSSLYHLIDLYIILIDQFWKTVKSQAPVNIQLIAYHKVIFQGSRIFDYTYFLTANECLRTSPNYIYGTLKERMAAYKKTM